VFDIKTGVEEQKRKLSAIEENTPIDLNAQSNG
jgi:hypothetical protein